MLHSPSPADEATAVAYNELLDSEFLCIEKALMLATNESPRLHFPDQQEKQISIDPISVKETVAYPRLDLSPSLLLAKTKFASASLPNSANSSPRFSSKKKKGKHQAGLTSLLAVDPLSQQHSVALSRLAELQARHQLRRSKSCGEGRATFPSEDFDLWSPKKVNYVEKIDHGYEEKNVTSFRNKTELPGFGYDYRKHMKASCDDEKFKCGALCLYLPGFGKGKPVRSRKEMAIATDNGVEKEMPYVISRTVSLEKFECGSWTSSAIIMENEDKDEDWKNRFFDLPLELIQSSVNDADSPVKAAFLFDKDLKGVLKTSTSRSMRRKSHESSRHVRFSTSSPPLSNPTSPTSCVTPRLRKAREDFNAFLQAQSA